MNIETLIQQKSIVRLTNIEGDQEDFADLLGNEGTFDRSSDGLCFSPKGRGDFLAMRVEKIVFIKNKVSIRTTLDNVFTYEIKTRMPWM